ncbi:MAG: GNAT family N-acetyltransferase [Chloroflexota bacterium]
MPTTDPEGLFRLEKQHIARAADVLARAFADEPLFAYAIPNPVERARRLPYFMQFETRHAILYGEVYAPSPQLQAIAGWLPSDRGVPSFTAVLRSGLFTLLRHGGPRAVASMRNFEDRFARMWHRHVPFPHIVLDVLGVDPEYQGQGYAGALLQPMLRRLDGLGMPACLGTTRQTNVLFYRHFGFRVIDRDDLDGTGVPLWLMLRHPSGDGDLPDSIATDSEAKAL